MMRYLNKLLLEQFKLLCNSCLVTKSELFLKNSYINILKNILFILIGSIACNCNLPTIPELSIQLGGQLEADIDHAVLKPDGTVWAWGSNSTGQLGNGTMLPGENPIRVKNLKDIVAFDLLEGAGVAADRKGDIWFWGNRLIWSGPNDIIVTLPTKISHLFGVISLEMIGTDINLLRTDGTVWELGFDHRNPTQYVEAKKVQGLEKIIRISGNLALTSDNTILPFPDRLVIVPEADGLLDNLKNVIQISSMSRSFTIVLKKDSTVWAWGRNKAGCLGNGTYDNSSVPVKVKNLNNIIKISANGAQCLALKSDGTVWFWGLGYLDLDRGIKIYQNFPILVDDLNNVQLIKAGGGNKSIVMKSDNWKIPGNSDTHSG